jgi:hypothetical protein
MDHQTTLQRLCPVVSQMRAFPVVEAPIWTLGVPRPSNDANIVPRTAKNTTLLTFRFKMADADRVWFEYHGSPARPRSKAS